MKIITDDGIVMVAGGDLGNDGLKLVFTDENGKKQRLHMSNAIKLIANDHERPNMSDAEKTMDFLDVHITAAHIDEINDKRFFVGPFAVKNDPMKYSAKTKKTSNFYLLVPFLTTIALQARKPEEKIQFNGVLSLPIDEYKKKEERIKYQQNIKGNYTVTFMSTPERRGWKIDIELDVVVVAEGMSVIYNQALTEDGKDFARPEWQGDAMGVLDIGAFTTDLAFIDENGEPDITLSRGIQNGIVHAIDEVAELYEQNQNTAITRTKVIEAMSEKNFIVKQGTTRVDLHQYAKAPFTSLVEDIKNELEDILALPQARETQRLLVCGGGIMFAKDYFKPIEVLVKDRHKIDVIYLNRDKEEAIFQNAEGNKKIAESFGRFKQKIEAIKTKAV